MKNVMRMLLGITVATGAALAADSPQFRGADRTGVVQETGLLNQWPEAGPAELWTAEGLGKGYSSVSIAKGKVYVAGMNESQDGFISVINAADGKVEKKLPYGKDVLNDQADGPRCTPTIDGDRLYQLSGTGVLYCIDLAQGKTAWEVNILDRFKAKNITWFLSESPLVDGDRVIVTPGGPDAGLAALNKMTGETIWATKGLSDAASYCSPIIFEHKGRRILTTETATMLVAADAATGALLWTHPHKTNYDIHGVTPVYKDGLLYYSGGYGSGGGCLELSADGSKFAVKWTDTTLDCQHHGVVQLDGYLYGTSHQSGKGMLVCLEMATGKVMWTAKEVRQGDVIAAEGMLYVYEGPGSGIMDLVKASPQGFESKGRFKITKGTEKHWAHPAIANGVLYVRRGDALMAFDIKAK